MSDDLNKIIRSAQNEARQARESEALRRRNLPRQAQALVNQIEQAIVGSLRDVLPSVVPITSSSPDNSSERQFQMESAGFKVIFRVTASWVREDGGLPETRITCTGYFGGRKKSVAIPLETVLGKKQIDFVGLRAAVLATADDLARRSA